MKYIGWRWDFLKESLEKNLTCSAGQFKFGKKKRSKFKPAKKDEQK